MRRADLGRGVSGAAAVAARARTVGSNWRARQCLGEHTNQADRLRTTYPMYNSTAGAVSGALDGSTETRLTADPGLPVLEALPDVLELEALARRAELVVLLQAADDDGALLLGQELGRVGEVLDDKEGKRSRNDGGQALENADESC